MDPSTSAYQLLALTALSGECSPDAVPRLGIRPSYGEKLLTKLKEEGYIKTHYRDRLRGYRLTNRGKKLLLTDNPVLSACHAHTWRLHLQRRFRGGTVPCSKISAWRMGHL